MAVRWYLRYGLSYRDVEELLAERGVEVDHVTVYRWVQTFTPEFIDAARPARHANGDRGSSTYVKVAGRWYYCGGAVDQHRQVIGCPAFAARDAATARRFFAQALRHAPCRGEVVTDRPGHPRARRPRPPAASPGVREQRYRDRPTTGSGGRLRPMRTKGPRSTRTSRLGTFVQKLRQATAVTTDHPSTTASASPSDHLALSLDPNDPPEIRIQHDPAQQRNRAAHVPRLPQLRGRASGTP